MIYFITSYPWYNSDLCAALDHWLEPPEPEEIDDDPLFTEEEQEEEL